MTFMDNQLIDQRFLIKILSKIINKLDMFWKHSNKDDYPKKCNAN